MNDKNNPYRNIDKSTLEKYLRGELSAREAYEVEKKIQQNQMLADAAEGFENLGDPGFIGEDLKDLEERVQKRIDAEPKVFPWATYYRAAAVLIILAVASYGIFELSKRNFFSSEKIALKTEEKDASETTQPAITPGDTVTRIIPGDSTYVISNQILSDTITQSDDLPAVDITAAAGTRDQQENLSGQLAQQTEVDEGGEGAAGPAPAEMILSDQELTAEEATVEENKTDRQTAKAADQPERSRVDVAGRAISEISTLTNTVHPGAPSPVAGFDAYNQYLKNNLRYPEAARSNQVEGLVIVEFFVDTDSTLQQLSIIQSLGSGCDEEAMRLIKEGPQWKPAYLNGMPARSRARQTITFTLEE